MKIHKNIKIEEACSEDANRTALLAPYLAVEHKRLVASDGRIMAVIPVQPGDGDISGHIPIDAIVAARKASGEIHANGLVAVQDGPTYARPDFGSFPESWKEHIVETALRDYGVMDGSPASGQVGLCFDVNLLFALSRAIGCTAKDGKVKLRFVAAKGEVLSAILVSPAAATPMEHFDEGEESTLKRHPLGLLMPCRMS